MAGLPLDLELARAPASGLRSRGYCAAWRLVQPGRACLRLADVGLGCRGCLPSRARVLDRSSRSVAQPRPPPRPGELAFGSHHARTAASWSGITSVRSAGEVARTAAAPQARPALHRLWPAAHAHPRPARHGRRSLDPGRSATASRCARSAAAEAPPSDLVSQDRRQSGRRPETRVTSSPPRHPAWRLSFQFCHGAGRRRSDPRRSLVALQRGCAGSAPPPRRPRAALGQASESLPPARPPRPSRPPGPPRAARALSSYLTKPCRCGADTFLGHLVRRRRRGFAPVPPGTLASRYKASVCRNSAASLR